MKGKLYPTIGLKKPGDHVLVNFGQVPFQFDIDGYMKVSANISLLLVEILCHGLPVLRYLLQSFVHLHDTVDCGRPHI